jgi:hypothetical protein
MKRMRILRYGTRALLSDHDKKSRTACYYTCRTCRQARKLACKVRDEYQHLAEGPYGRGMDGAVRAGPEGAIQSASAPASTSTALIVGDKEQQFESDAARRAREVCFP